MDKFIKELRDRLTFPFVLLSGLFILGTLGYKVMNWNEWSFLKCAFMTAITLTAVGFSDVLGVEDSPIALVYTIVLAFVGLGIVLYCISSITAFVLEGGISVLLRERKMLKRIAKLENHFIIAGAGSTGLHVLKEMYQTGANFVVVEGDAEKIHDLEEKYSGIHYVIGDATEDDNLIDAGIERARGLVACLSNDKDNLYITVSAKSLNPWIQVVARAVAIEMKSKLERVGADSVVSPNQIGGMRMASEMLRPHVVSFLDKMLRAKDQSVRVGEVTVKQGSVLDGKQLKEARITEHTGLIVITVLPPDSEDYVYNPMADFVLRARSVIIVIGDMASIKKLKKLATP